MSTQSAYRIVALLAENSRVHHADEYIYGDHGWKASAQEAMKEGWNAIVSPGYVRSVEKNLNVDLSGLDYNTQAFEVLSELYAQLYDLHSDGLWTGLLLDNASFEGPADGPTLHNPNRDSWVRAAFLFGVNVWYTSSPCGCIAAAWPRDWAIRLLDRTIIFAETMKIDVSTGMTRV